MTIYGGSTAYPLEQLSRYLTEKYTSHVSDALRFWTSQKALPLSLLPARMDRRQFLSTVGAGFLSLSGCTSAAPTDPTPTRTPRPDEPLAPVEGTWATYQFDPARTGHNPAKGHLHADRSGRWTKFVTESYEPFAVADGSVYSGHPDGSVHALDASTGDNRWSALVLNLDDTDAARWRTMTLSDGTLYAGNHLELHAVDLERREDRWLVEFDEASHGGTAVSVGDIVVVETSSTTLIGLDADTGDATWELDTEDNGIVTNLAADDERVYFMTNDGTVHALDLRSGDERWQTTPPASWSVDDLAVAGGQVFLTSGTFWALDVETGDLAWELDTPDRATEHQLLPVGRAAANGGPQASAPAIADGTVYAKTFEEQGVAVDAASGRVQWAVDLAPGYVPPVVADGAVYFADGNAIRTYDPSTGEPTGWEFEAIAGVESFVVVDGVVFATGDRGFLQALTGRRQA